MNSLLNGLFLLLIGAMKVDSLTLIQAAQSDPLIDQGGQKIVIWGSILLLVGVVAIVGFVSRKIEHAIVAALAMSLLLIGFFVLIKH